MKKIFATILALVLVLAMGSSLAMSCLTIDWTGKTNCGMGTVEVVPYVLNNANGGMVSYTANDCAGAVNSQYIYYAIKVTVQDDPNQDWWDNAKLEVTLGDGLAPVFYKAPASTYLGGGQVQTALNPAAITTVTGPTYTMNDGGAGADNTVDTELWHAKNTTSTLSPASDKDVSAGTYYLARIPSKTGAFDSWCFTTGFNPADNLFAAQVVNVSGNVQVCAKLSASSDPLAFANNAAISTNRININGKDVWVLRYIAGSMGTFPVQFANGNWTWAIGIETDPNNRVWAMYDGSAFRGVRVTRDGGATYRDYHSYAGDTYYSDTQTWNASANCGDPWYSLIKDSLAAINLTWGWPVDMATAQSNLKWTGKSEDCNPWGSAATAIVDTNCVIEIPKTGDVSVVAYAVMALVTAAGALKFRK